MNTLINLFVISEERIFCSCFMQNATIERLTIVAVQCYSCDTSAAQVMVRVNINLTSVTMVTMIGPKLKTFLPKSTIKTLLTVFVWG